MEIIAKTNEGVIITASENEVKEVLRAVTGKTPEKISIGDKIPAIDYATTLTNLRNLQKDDDYKNFLYYMGKFNKHVEELKNKVNSLEKIGK